jgi:hypothetical protein
MSKPKLLISVSGGIAHLHGASEDMQVYLVDWDEEEYHEENYPDKTFDERMLEEWSRPTDIIEGDFEEYVEKYLKENMQVKS